MMKDLIVDKYLWILISRTKPWYERWIVGDFLVKGEKSCYAVLSNSKTNEINKKPLTTRYSKENPFERKTPLFKEHSMYYSTTKWLQYKVFVLSIRVFNSSIILEKNWQHNSKIKTYTLFSSNPRIE